MLNKSKEQMGLQMIQKNVCISPLKVSLLIRVIFGMQSMFKSGKMTRADKPLETVLQQRSDQRWKK